MSNSDDAINNMKPCPFCGSKRLYVQFRSSGRYPYRPFVFAKCKICGAQTGLFNYQGNWENEKEFNWEDRSVYDAIEAWNLRTQESTQ